MARPWRWTKWTHVYERVRQALPPLLSSYDAVADLFTPAPVRISGAQAIPPEAPGR